MEKIAIVGLSCLFPDAPNPEKYWQNLLQQKDSRSRATAQQMGVNADIFFDEQKGTADKYYCLHGGYIRNFNFDPHGYKLPADYINSMDDLFQWSLYVAREALRDSGHEGKTAVLQRTGIILGNLSFPTQSSHHLFAPLYQHALEEATTDLLDGHELPLKQLEPPHDISPDNLMIAGYPAAFVGKALGLGGVNFALDAACASSLYAVKLASQYLISGKADLMLAGAVSRADPFFINMGFSIFHAYPEQGVGSQPLNNGSGGLYAGEGAGMFVLKRHRDAVRDGDRIYAVISGIGLSNDGAGKFLLQPNPKGQVLAFERAYADSTVDPTQIDYIECHATGTPVGDKTELNSMESFFEQYHNTPLIGSAKSNFGHLLTAAGMVGMSKVILGMAHQQLPATIHLTDPVTSKGGVFSADKVVSETIDWPRQDTIKRGAVSAFGFGGTNAHLILEETAQPEPPSEKLSKTPMAIVGMDAFFGDYDGLDAFGEAIYHGRQAFIDVPNGRWQGLDQYPDLLKAYGFADGKAPKGAYISDFDMDFFHFKIPPNKDVPIPQQLLILQVADRALQDAGMEAGGNVAVIIAAGAELALHRFRGRCDLTWQLPESLAESGIDLTPEQMALLETITKDSIHERAEVNQYTSFIGNIMASRISSQWDFSGPSFTLSAEENSTFKALEVAQMFLAAGEVDAVVVGAVDLAGSPENVLLRNQQNQVNSGTATMSYDEQADGWLVGEGAGVVVLKRLEDASQDRVYAVIDEVTVEQANDSSPTANKVHQVTAQTLQAQGVTPEQVGYVELFGSGLPAEDSAEMGGITAVYQKQSRTATTAIGSVKANIGHTFTASGIASLIKTAHALYHRYIPPTPNWTAPKAIDRWQKTPFYVPTEARPWLVNKNEKRLAAVNGLGADGSYAHLLLSGVAEIPESPLAYQPTMLLPLAAPTVADLQTQLTTLQQAIETSDNLRLLAAETFATFQNAPQKQLVCALVGDSQKTLLREIKMTLKGLPIAHSKGQTWQTPGGSYCTFQPLGKTGKLAFVYPGAFSAYPHLGRDLFYLFPELHKRFAEQVDGITELVGDEWLYPRSLHRLSDKEAKKHAFRLVNNAVVMLQAGAVYSTLVTKAFREQFSIQPQAALGYSLGEMTMMFGTEVWSVQDNKGEMVRNSPLFRDRLSGAQNAIREFWNLPPAQDRTPIWAIYVVKTAVERVRQALTQAPKVYLTHINTPNEVVIAGDPAQCAGMVQALNCDHMFVPYNHAIHCEPMRSEKAEFAKLNNLPISDRPNMDFYFAANPAKERLESEQVADNIATASCQQVDFPALIQRAYADGARLFIELGPRSACTWWIQEILHEQPHLAVGINRRSLDDHALLVRVLAQLVSHQVPMDLSPLYVSVQAEQKPARSLVRPVSLAHTPVREVIVTADNQQAFAEIAIKEKVVAPPTYTPPIARPVAPILVAPPPPPKKEEEKPMIQETPQPMPALNDAVTQTTVNGQITDAVSDDFVNQQLQKMHDVVQKSHQTHSAFLQMRQEAITQIGALIGQLSSQPSPSAPAQTGEPSRVMPPQDPNRPNNYTVPDEVIWDRDDLIGYAGGSIVPMFGKEFAIIDSYKRRVRLPMLPYLLVDRITKLDAKVNVYEPSSMTTEYDIPFDAWYSTDGQIPWAVSVESGQCDLLLISYMGIDFQNKGERVYRLLDCTLTFLEDMPLEGHTLRYDISINSFAKSGDSLLFFFSYNCYVGDKMVLKMRNGCAGFFSDEELAAGKGIIITENELEAKRKLPKQYFEPLLRTDKTAVTRDELLQLSRGDIAGVFGPSYEQGGANPSLRMPPEAVLMIDRITSVDPQGGAWGLGMIMAEKELEPDDWYFPCHFKDDEVLAGSLVAEGCCQLLQFFLLYLGMQTQTHDARFQPVLNLGQVVRTRKQLVAASATLTYRLEITELGVSPEPYAKANVDIIYDGIVVVDFKNLGLRLSEKSANDPYALNNNALLQMPALTSTHSASSGQIGSVGDVPQANYNQSPALYNDDHIKHFAMGSISACFGPDYQVFEGRRIPRTPNGDLQLFHRVVEINAERLNFKDEPNLTTEYDVPVNPWFGEKNNYAGTMPYSVLMEIALQPCGFLSAYLGSTLPYADEDFYFRNLDGNGRLHRDFDLRGRTISNKVALLSQTALKGIIIQKYSYALSVDGELFYEGTAVFGYFQPESLINQVGLDQGKEVLPWWKEQQATLTTIDLKNQNAPVYQAPAGNSHYRLAGGQLNFLDTVKTSADGGRNGLGYIYAERTVDPSDWFFSCHFYQDPVMPGSLGVEAVLEAMQTFAIQHDLGAGLNNPHFTHADNHEVVWMYRGQIVPKDPQMYLEVDITNIERTAEQLVITGNANLWKSGLRIYAIKDIAIRLVAGG